jgi:CheY-like chemotaxis protein
MLNPPDPYPRPPLVMIVTRQEWVSLSVETLFSPRGYAALHGDYTGAQAQQRLRETPVDLLVVDRDLRDMSGLDLCRMARQKALVTPTTPIVLLGAGAWPQEEKLEALRSGVVGGLLAAHGQRAAVRAGGHVGARQALGGHGADPGAAGPGDRAVQCPGPAAAGGGGGRQRAAPRAAAGLRGLSAELAPEPTRTLAGNGGAENAMATVAATLRAQGRASDTIGRLSGTEFVIVAPDTDPAGVRGLVKRLRTAIDTMSATAGSPALRVRFGAYAVSNFGEASIAPTEMLVRAAEALRGVQHRRHGLLHPACRTRLTAAPCRHGAGAAPAACLTTLPPLARDSASPAARRLSACWTCRTPALYSTPARDFPAGTATSRARVVPVSGDC